MNAYINRVSPHNDNITAIISYAHVAIVKIAHPGKSYTTYTAVMSNGIEWNGLKEDFYDGYTKWLGIERYLKGVDWSK